MWARLSRKHFKIHWASERDTHGTREDHPAVCVSLAVLHHGCCSMVLCVLIFALAIAPLAPAQESPHSRLVFDRVEFAPASAALSAEAQWRLRQNVRAMEVYDDVVVWIEGHAAVHEGGVDPLELGDRRARAVAAAFTAAGIDPERIAGPVSFGAAKPLKRDNARRVEMREK